MNILLILAVLPFLSIDRDVQDNSVCWQAVVPPTTNYFPAEVKGTNFWLQVGTLNGQWLTVEPKLDAFGDRWTTNTFCAVPPEGVEFFRIVNDPSLGTNAPAPILGPVKLVPTIVRPMAAFAFQQPPPPPTNECCVRFRK